MYIYIYIYIYIQITHKVAASQRVGDFGMFMDIQRNWVDGENPLITEAALQDACYEGATLATIKPWVGA